MRTFLIVGTRGDSPWVSVVQDALSTLGDVAVVSRKEVLAAIYSDRHDIIIIDMQFVKDSFALILQIHEFYPTARIVLVTESPTWERARLALLLGAADYFRRSLDAHELRSKIEHVLRSPVLPPLFESGDQPG